MLWNSQGKNVGCYDSHLSIIKGSIRLQGRKIIRDGIILSPFITISCSKKS